MILLIRSWGYSGSPGTPRVCSAELKGPRKCFRIQPEIFDFDPDLGLRRGKTKPKYPARYPQTGTQRSRTMLCAVPISACFGDAPKLSNCELAQPSGVYPGSPGRRPSKLGGVRFSLGVAWGAPKGPPFGRVCCWVPSCGSCRRRLSAPLCDHALFEGYESSRGSPGTPGSRL